MAYTLWQRAGAMIVNIDHDAAKMADRLWKANFRVVFPQSHVGNTKRYADSTLDKYLQPYRMKGFIIGHWGYLPGENPEGEAYTAASVHKAIQGRFYVPNPEVGYKYTQSYGNCPECFLRSERFINAFLSSFPLGTPVGVSSYGRFDMADLHWAPWLNRLKARALPQAYINEVGPSVAPKACYFGAIDVEQPHNKMYNPTTKALIPGFPKSYVHVSIAKPDPNDRFPMDIDDWIAELRLARAAGHTIGFSAYEAENFTDADLVKLGNAIKTYNLAGV